MPRWTLIYLSKITCLDQDFRLKVSPAVIIFQLACLSKTWGKLTVSIRSLFVSFQMLIFAGQQRLLLFEHLGVVLEANTRECLQPYPWASEHQMAPGICSLMQAAAWNVSLPLLWECCGTFSAAWERNGTSLMARYCHSLPVLSALPPLRQGLLFTALTPSPGWLGVVLLRGIFCTTPGVLGCRTESWFLKSSLPFTLFMSFCMSRTRTGMVYMFPYGYLNPYKSNK